MDAHAIGRLLIVFGALILIAGVLLLVFGRLPPIGRLPGDIVIRRENFTIYLPLMTMLLLSVILTVVLTLLARWWR